MLLGLGGDQPTADGATRRFIVQGGEVVRHDASGIEPSGGEPRLALVTCWPFDAKTCGPLRYVLWADLDGRLSAS